VAESGHSCLGSHLTGNVSRVFPLQISYLFEREIITESLFGIFADRFNALCHRRQLDSHTCCAYSLLQWIVLPVVHEENVSSHRQEAGGGRSFSR